MIEIICAREDVQEAYHRPEDQLYPLVCLDETTKEMGAETRDQIPEKKGCMEYVDFDYHRCDVGKLVYASCSLAGMAPCATDPAKPSG